MAKRRENYAILEYQTHYIIKLMDDKNKIKESDKIKTNEKQKALLPLLDPDDIQVLQKQLQKYEFLKQ